MATTINRLVFVFVTFMFAMTGLGSALRIVVEPRILSKESGQLSISCVADDPEYSSRTVLTMEIIKESIDQSIINIDDDQKFGKGRGFNETNMKATGKIDNDGGRSVLTFIVTNPTVDDAGIYRCQMMFLEESGQINNNRAFGNASFYKCPDEWTFFQGDKTCVKVFKKRLNWDQSRAACLKLGGDLVKIRDEDKNNFVYDLIRKSGSLNLVWLGIRNTAESGFDFKFVGGSSLGTYRPWHPEQPDGDYPGDEKCVSMWNRRFAHAKEWQDYYCKFRFHYACSQPAKRISDF